MKYLFRRGLFAGICTLAAGMAATCASVPAQARSIVIDINTSEIIGDANNGDAVPLAFPINYGAGLKSGVIINLSDSCCTLVNGAPTYVAGMSVAGSPGDSFFANLFSDGTQRYLPAVSLSNATETSRPTKPVDQASNFRFGTMQAPISPLPPGSPQCDYIGISTYCYGPLSGAANFLFTDLSATGVTGDFGLTLVCNSVCANIGFSLNGLNFSANSYNPLAPPTQLVSADVVRNGNFITSSTFNFVFRNAAPVPEPATWAMMLLGFGMIGFAVRRQQRGIAPLAA